MRLKKSLVVFFVLFARICFGGIVVKTRTPSTDISSLIDAAVNILTSCYGEDKVLGVLGNAPRTLLSKLWLKKPIPVIILNDEKRITEYDNRKSSPVRPHVCLVIGFASSVVSTMSNGWLKVSVPVLAFSLPVNRRNGCQYINNFINAHLRLGFYNANVLCVGREKNIYLTTGNYYTNQAPHPWQSMGYYTTYFRPMYGLFRPYRTDNEMCLNLYYEKTTNLAGNYIVLLNYDESRHSKEWEMQHIERIFIRREYINSTWMIVMHQMNATPIVHRLHDKKLLSEYSHNMWSVLIIPSPMQSGRDIPIPGLQQSDIIIMQSRGNKSKLQKFLGIVDVYTQYCIIVSLVITLIFFKYIASQRLIPGTLNIFRLVCNTGFQNLPVDLKSRIFLVCLFLYAITIHGIFSAEFASVLTLEVPIHIPQTIEELQHLKYTIFLDDSYLFIYKNDPTIYAGGQYCAKMTLTSPHVACVENKYFLMDQVIDGLSLSSKELFVTQLGFKVAGPWPFTKRVTTIILRMSSARLLEPLDLRIMLERSEEMYAYKMSLQSSNRAITVNDLRFAFIILGIGLASGLISFIIEISMNSILQMIKNMRRYLRRTLTRNGNLS